MMLNTTPCSYTAYSGEYFFEGSEELTYSDDFQTDKSYDHKTVYQRTHAARTGSGHAGSGVAFDHSLSPLYGMTVLQLKQLLLSLRAKVEGKFTVLCTCT